MRHLYQEPTFHYEQAFSAARLNWPGRSVRLALRVVGRFTSHGRYRNRQRVETPCPHLVQAGRMVVGWEGRSWTVGPGDCLVFFPGREITVEERPGPALVHTWFRCDGPDAAAVFAQCGLTPEQPLRQGDWHARLAPLLDEAFHAIADNHAHPLLSEMHAWRLIGALAVEAPPVPADLDLAEQVRRHLDQHVDRAVSLAGLAVACRVSRSTLCRQFRRAYGRSPQEYLIDRRLDRARRLLAERGSTVAAVARSCGLSDAQHLRRLFRSRFGTTPRRLG